MEVAEFYHAMTVAVEHQNLQSISRLIESSPGAIEALPDDHLSRLLQRAIGSEDYLLFSTVLGSVSTLAGRFGENGSNILFTAITENSSLMALDLLDKGIDTEFIDNQQCTAMHRAVQSSMLTVIERLIEMGADIDAQDFHGRTPLIYASLQTDMPNLMYLLELGADPEVENLKGSTIYDAQKTRVQLCEKIRCARENYLLGLDAREILKDADPVRVARPRR